ncbi:MAG: alkaline phosphatase family protein [Thermoanaerobaculia bacterium]
MIARLRPLAAAGALLALAATAAPPRAAQPASSPESRAARALLLSFDGVGGERLARLLEQPGKLPHGGFRRIAERGLYARRSRPPVPSLTAPSHVTHVTGALPEKTGIVSNEMLDRSRPFGTKLSGFDAPIRAETLWQAARRQGKRVGVLLYPGADGKTPERRADWGMNWVEGSRTRPRLQRVGAASWHDAADESRSFSPPRSVRLDFRPGAPAFRLIALDTADDGRCSFDRLRVEPEEGLSVEIGPGDWFPAEVRGERGRTGAWCKLLRLAPDLSETELYVGDLHANEAYPEAFRRELDLRVGFWPGVPDEHAFGSQSARPEVFLEQADRLADFLTRAALLALERQDWDLMLLYQPPVDEVSHEFFLTDPRQQGYTPERAARFAGFVDSAYALADRSLDRIERALSPRDAIFVTSDHGMVPLLSAVYPNEVLRQAGFLRLAADGRIDPGSAAVAITTSGIAHVYVNAATAPPGALEAIERLFAGFRPDGESPWDRVARRSAAGDLGLDAPESGDIILLARPGVSVSMRAGHGRLTGRPADYGGHGYRNAFAPLDATFLAAGPGIAPERVEEFPSWRIASRLCRALGIQPPRDAAP